jgi:group I intron endonuclease
MKITVPENCSLENPGVYMIKNMISGKFYIGSTTMPLLKRVWHHISLLRTGTHKNTHLQRSYEKHGESNFEVFIIENTEKSETLKREQFWIDNSQSSDLFNINSLASGTPNMSKETIEKRAATMRRKYASGEIISSFHKGHTPWNKNKTKEEISYDYLKGIKKTISEKVKSKWNKQSEERRNKSSEIYVYDKEGKFLRKFRSSMDLQEWSLTEENNFPIGGRFSKSRRGRPLNFLHSANINNACKSGKPYKELIFNIKPLHKEICVEKLGKNGEGCDS